MAVRLHYDGLVTELVEPELASAVRQAVAWVRPGQSVVVFATYTAMWELHQVLSRLDSPAALQRSPDAA
jgi:hypothetical protein